MARFWAMSDPPGEPPLLSETLPTLASALEASLRRENEPELAEQVGTVRVYATCACGEEWCGLVHLMPDQPTAGPDYRVVTPDAVVTVGVWQERLHSVEDDFSLGEADPGTPKRIAEYRALQGKVPTRDP